MGVRPAASQAPILLLHGDRDRVVLSAHSAWLAAHGPTAELRRSPDDGHISILTHAGAALQWLREHTDG